jgi:hypothetical protein
MGTEWVGATGKPPGVVMGGFKGWRSIEKVPGVRCRVSGLALASFSLAPGTWYPTPISLSASATARSICVCRVFEADFPSRMRCRIWFPFPELCDLVIGFQFSASLVLSLSSARADLKAGATSVLPLSLGHSSTAVLPFHDPMTRWPNDPITGPCSRTPPSRGSRPGP